jgi:ribosome-binding factor A
MKQKTLRQEKVNELLRQTLSDILAKELSLKAGVVMTVRKIEVTPDLRQAFVGISVFPEEEFAYVLETLQHELYHVQGTLNRRLHMRPLPKIRFLSDTTESEAQVIEDLLLKIRDE